MDLTRLSSKGFLTPDYDDSFDVDCIDDDDDVKEIKRENNISNNFNNNNMNSTPFGSVPFQSISTPTPKFTWGSGNGNNGNNNGNNNSGIASLNTTDSTGMGFKAITPNSQTNQSVEAINRNKRFVICDFLDCVVETLSSNGVPGLIPRDVYDLKPRFEVWNKLAAFNPEKLILLIPSNLVTSTTGDVADGWTATINYFCLAISSYIRIPFGSCITISYDPFIQKELVLDCAIGALGNNIDKNDIVNVGIYSGINGQSNRDVDAANRMGIDYVDLVRLINNMY